MLEDLAVGDSFKDRLIAQSTYFQQRKLNSNKFTNSIRQSKVRNSAIFDASPTHRLLVDYCSGPTNILMPTKVRANTIHYSNYE